MPRNDFFDSFFEGKKMRKLFPHRETALRAYLQEIGGLPAVLSAERERRLLEQAIRGKNKKAQRELIEANLRLVVTIATRFQGNGLPLMDLIQEGNLGLIDAIDQFDLSRDNRFSTYAKFKIVRRIENALAGSLQPDTTPYAADRMLAIEKVVAVFLAQGIEPTPEQLSARVHIPKDQVVELLILMQSPLSLDLPLSMENGGQEDGTLAEILEAPALVLSDEGVSLLQDLYPLVREVLTEAEQHVVDLRLGVSDGISHDYEEIASNFVFPNGKQLGEERVRQIERGAIRKIRSALKERLKDQKHGIIRSDLF